MFEGTWRIYDANLHIQAKRPNVAAFSKEAEAWEKEYIKRVLEPIYTLLEDLGYRLEQQTYIFNYPQNRYARKGDLRLDLLESYGGIEVNFFQNINAPKRPDNAGRYEFNKDKLMPYLMRLEMIRTMRRITDFVEANFNFKRQKEDMSSREIGPNGITALEYVLARYQDKSTHFDGTEEQILRISEYNRKGANDCEIKHGARVWFFDVKGRLRTGIAYYNINNMWWVITGKYGLKNEGCFDLHATNPGQPRVKRNSYMRKRRLSQVAFDAMSKGNTRLADAVNGIIEREFGDVGLLITREQARQYFDICGLKYSSIDKARFDRLRKLVNQKLIESGHMNNTLAANRKTKFKPKRQGCEYAYIGCKSYYFSDRDAVTFEQSGRIIFAGWADEQNVQPILEAFIQWCDGIKNGTTRRKKLLSHV